MHACNPSAQKDGEFKVSLGYLVRFCLKTKQQTKQKTKTLEHLLKLRKYKRWASSPGMWPGGFLEKAVPTLSVGQSSVTKGNVKKSSGNLGSGNEGEPHGVWWWWYWKAWESSWAQEASGSLPKLFPEVTRVH
jgi:hypothetical protein